MRSSRGFVSLTLLLSLLTGCAAVQDTLSEVLRKDGTAEAYVSDVLGSDQDGDLGVAAQLALGTLLLEETDHAVTPDQASSLLPLWRALRSQDVTSQDEISAVLRGIEQAMTEPQLHAIADMALDRDELRAWTEEQRVPQAEGGPGSWGAADEQPPSAGDTGGAAAAPLGLPPAGQMGSAEDLPPQAATRVAEFRSMSDEERGAMMATAQAGGGPGAGLRQGAGAPGSADAGSNLELRLLLRPLVMLLEDRAA
jgi:hypothetical protein